MGVQDLYHRAPYPARVAAASARGLVLRHRRFGPGTDDLVVAALERDAWSAGAWNRYLEPRLDQILEVAHHRVRAYQSVPAAAWTGGLAALPLLQKDRLRADPRSFVREDAPGHLITEHTSGTSATPLSLSISRDDYRSWYALVEARWRNWYGVSRQDRWGIVGGQAVVPPGATEPPYWVWNAAMHQLYLSSYHVAEHTAAAYVRAIDDHRITYLLGYPSSMYALALACQHLGIRPRPLRVVIGNAEPVLAYQREVISEVFGCPVRETYGMAEYVTAASECEHGRMHLWPEVGVTEVVEHDGPNPVAADQTGRLVCTSLLNTTMPLIRYLVGDAGAVAPADERCPCGRTLPILRAVEGRCDDLVRTMDGRLIGRLDPVFKGDLPIQGAQIIQETLDRFRVLVVSAPGFGPEAERSITRRLRERVGDVRVELELIDELPLGANGKFKAVISRLTVSDG